MAGQLKFQRMATGCVIQRAVHEIMFQTVRTVTLTMWQPPSLNQNIVVVSGLYVNEQVINESFL